MLSPLLRIFYLYSVRQILRFVYLINCQLYCWWIAVQAGSQAGSGTALPLYQKQSQPGAANGMPYASPPQQQTPSRLSRPPPLPSTAGILTPHMQVTTSIILMPLSFYPTCVSTFLMHFFVCSCSSTFPPWGEIQKLSVSFCANPLHLDFINDV